ncbi:MAG: hypothetical protein RL660_1467 [Bacteroidota bacterium]|jgi:plasmid stabilization system protein ParE
MAYKIQIEPSASIDIIEACNYYASLPIDTASLIAKFLDDIDDAFDALSLNPFYAKRHKDYRAYPLKKFPYIIFILVDESAMRVNVLAIFHTRQDSTKYP